MATRAAGRLAPESPDKARQIRLLMNLAESVTSREDVQPVWDRSDETVQMMWGRVLDLTRDSMRELLARRIAARSRWADVGKQAEKALPLAREEVKAPGLSRREQALLQQAEIALDRAQRLAKRGANAQASSAAEIALARAQEIHRAWEALHARFSDRSSLHEWSSMVQATIAESARIGTTALVIDKLRRRLDVYASGKKVASFSVELGSKGLRQKEHAGDKATPEGRYRVVAVKNHGQTHYYKALLINYPNDEDRSRFELHRRRGQVPKGVGLGSLIEIHGEGGRGKDWTDGCIALRNNEMDRLFQYARVNMLVTIVGTVP
ncbi:MAG TPA: L,D-transpeptidase [Thermoanaerobaculia bacterium]|nr:L,D-transpeptidase [Thermoanaerobaculia bacterium]